MGTIQQTKRETEKHMVGGRNILAGRGLRVGRGVAQLKCNWFVTEYYSWEHSILTPSLEHTGRKNDASRWKYDWGLQDRDRGRIKVSNRHRESPADSPVVVE